MTALVWPTLSRGLCLSLAIVLAVGCDEGLHASGQVALETTRPQPRATATGGMADQPEPQRSERMAEPTVASIPQAVLDSEVMTVLGKAKACYELLDGIKQGGVVLESDDSREWVEHMALEALGDALNQLETEYVKREIEALRIGAGPR